MPSEEIEILMRGASQMNAAIREEFALQGHTLTGGLERSLQNHIEKTKNITEVTGTANGYIEPLNEGVSAEDIPFGSYTGATTSKYIQGLVKYVELRMGKTGKEALSIAFAIAKTQKKEGMPTEGSHAFSSTGERKGFLERANDKGGRVVDQTISHGLDEMMDHYFSQQKNETV
jgi:hypothetical protein